MDKNLNDRIITAVNGYIPVPVDDFLEDEHKDAFQAKLNLVMTLKHWANPEGGYYVALSPDELYDYFDYLQKILHDPQTLLTQEKNFTPEGKNFASELVRIKLNKIADEIVAKDQKLAQAVAEQWWKQKTLAEQKETKRQYEALNQTQKISLTPQMAESLTPSNSSVSGIFDPYPYYMMNNHAAELLLDATVRIALETARVSAHAIRAGGQIGSNGGNGGNCNGNDALTVAAGVGMAAIVASGIIGGTYAVKKTSNSFLNILSGNKVLRSLYRLAGIGGGGYYGAVWGVVAGAALGSVIPGLGTAAGAIIGGIFGSGLGAGIGALLTKYTAKLISAVIYPNEINPTNPEKYKLTEPQIKNLSAKNLNVDVINQMIIALKNEKSTIRANGSLPWTKAREYKNELNALLKRIKNGDITGPFPIAGQVFNPRLNKSLKSSAFESTHAKLVSVGIGGDSLIPAPSAPPAMEEEILHREISTSVSRELFNHATLLTPR